MRKYLLKEMAIYDEDEVFSQNAVASVSTEEVQDLEGDDLTICVYKKINTIRIPENYHLQPTDIGTIVKHHCTHRNKKKAALLALPAIINAQYITQPWRKKTTDGKVQRGKDKRPSGMVSAPILIDGVKYLCNITQKLALNGDIFPYALTLKDENGNIIEGEKMDSTLKVPDSNSKYTTSGHTHFDEVTTSPDTNPSIYANLSKKDISVNINSDRSGEFLSATRYIHGADYVSESRITNENKRYKNMDRKNTIRLTESELKNIITESVKNILKENNLSDTMSARQFGEMLKTGKYDTYIKKCDYEWANQMIDMFTDPYKAAIPIASRASWLFSLYDGDIEFQKQMLDFINYVFERGNEKFAKQKGSLGENRVIKENYNPVHEGIMNFHSDMNALRSDIDEIIDGLYDTNARERLRLMDKKLAQIGAEFAKIESTLNFLGNQN